MKRLLVSLFICFAAVQANNWSEQVFTLDGVVIKNVLEPGIHRYAVGWQILEGIRAVNEGSPCHTLDVPRRCAWIKVWTVPADETAEMFKANVGRSGAADSGRPLIAGFFRLCKSAGCTEDDKTLWIYQALHTGDPK